MSLMKTFLLAAAFSGALSERVLPEQGLFGEKETVQQKLGDVTITRFVQAVIGS